MAFAAKLPGKGEREAHAGEQEDRGYGRSKSRMDPGEDTRQLAAIGHRMNDPRLAQECAGHPAEYRDHRPEAAEEESDRTQERRECVGDRRAGAGRMRDGADHHDLDQE